MQPGLLTGPERLENTTRQLRALAALAFPLLIAFVISACGDTGSGATAPPSPAAQAHVTTTVPPDRKVPNPAVVRETTAAGALPAFLDKAAARIKPLYQGAMDHGDVYAQIPCYCGCALYEEAHSSLMSCFIQDKAADGQITWVDHSTTCNICTGIADLTLAELQKGTAPTQIRAMVHAKYKYTNVWTDTPPIQ